MPTYRSHDRSIIIATTQGVLELNISVGSESKRIYIDGNHSRYGNPVITEPLKLVTDQFGVQQIKTYFKEEEFPGLIVISVLKYRVEYLWEGVTCRKSSLKIECFRLNHQYVYQRGISRKITLTWITGGN